MKKALLLLLLLMPMVSFAQEEDEKRPQTKFEEFVSKTGYIVKFIDIATESISQVLGDGFPIETTVRTVIRGNEKSYFFRLEVPATTTSSSRSELIEYSDLIEINKALDVLFNEVENDKSLVPDYLENRFVSDDGFRIGYYVMDSFKTKKPHATWFMRIENKTVRIKNIESAIATFKTAQAKIEELLSKE